MHLAVQFGERRWLGRLAWTIAFLLCLAYSAIAVGFVVFDFRVIYPLAAIERPVYAVLFAGVAVVLSCLLFWLCRFLTRRMARRGWSPRSGLLACALMALPLSGTVAYLALDMPPIEEDHTLADIPASGEDAQASYALAMTYAKGEGDRRIQPGIAQLDQEAIFTNALAFADMIEGDWRAVAEAREVIKRLDSYDAVADLTSPREDTPVMSFVAYRNLTRVYRAYAALRVAQGRPEEAARHLAQLHSVVRKMMPYSRILMHKMLSADMARQNIVAAHRLFTSGTNVTPEALAILRPAFAPLSDQDVSLHRALIGEYLSIKSTFSGARTRLAASVDPYAKSSAARFVAGLLVSPVFLNRNRTLHDASHLYRGMIEMADQGRSLEGPLNQYWGQRHIRNAMGHDILWTLTPSYDHAANVLRQLQAASDTLAMEIRDRLGGRPGLGGN